MTSQAVVTTCLGLYLAWAVVLSDSLFNRIWGLALCSLVLLTSALYYLPLSAYTLPLAVLTLLDFALCVALSPFQILLYRTESINPNYKALEILYPNSKGPDNGDGPRESLFAEFVLPSPHLVTGN